MANTIGVGIIGAHPARGWAAAAHVPALKALPDYAIVAVATTRQDSAEAAARAFGVPLAFDTPEALVSHPDVDLVAITVKVPHHHALAMAAIAAGKMVYCEWPLGNGLDEAVSMANAAETKGVRTVVGLQARVAPAMAFARDLVAQGYVGEVLSTTLVGSGSAWGPFVDRSSRYLLDGANGATVLTIPFGHTVDGVCQVLGEFRTISAITAQRRTHATLAETGEIVPMTSRDQVAVVGTLESGAVATIHYRGGSSRGTNLLWEINGTDGDLQITASGGHAQMVPLTLRGGQGKDTALTVLEPPAQYRWAPPVDGVAFNVAQMYALLADDLRHGTRRCPAFADGVRRHRTIAAIEAAARTETAQHVSV